jgi:hypothetical protein
MSFFVPLDRLPRQRSAALANRVLLDLQVLLVATVTMELPETTVVADLPAPMPLPTMFSCPCLLNARVKALLVHEDLKDLRDLTDLLETKDVPALMADLDPLDLKDPEDHPDSLETQDPEDLPVLPEISDLLDPPHLVLLASPVDLDPLALPDVPELLATTDNPADKDLLETAAHEDLPEALARPAAQEPLDSPVHQALATTAHRLVLPLDIKPVPGPVASSGSSCFRIVSVIAFLGVIWLQKKQQLPAQLCRPCPFL